MYNGWMSRLTKDIYEVDVGGTAGKSRPRRTFLDQIGKVSEGPGQENPNRRACMSNLMTVEEVKDVCKDQVEGSDLCLPQRKTGVMLCMYVCKKLTALPSEINCNLTALTCHVFSILVANFGNTWASRRNI
jgi:hypothetical protein